MEPTAKFDLKVLFLGFSLVTISAELRLFLIGPDTVLKNSETIKFSLLLAIRLTVLVFLFVSIIYVHNVTCCGILSKASVRLMLDVSL